MIGNMMQPATRSLIIVCDEKERCYANYLIQLIGQKDDVGDSIVGIADDSVSAAIFTTKQYKDNLSQIPSSQHILFIGLTKEAKEQVNTIPDKFNELGMHYGWLGKRAVLYVDDVAGEWLKLKDDKAHYTEFWTFSKSRGMVHADALAQFAKKLDGGFADKLMPTLVAAPKMLIDRNKTISEVKAQQYRTLIKVFYEDGLKSFVEG